MTADPRATADAARCLAIDKELATQSRSGALTPEAYTRRTEALTAERKRITNPYGAHNTPPHPRCTGPSTGDALPATIARFGGEQELR